MFITIQFTETALRYIHYTVIGAVCIFILAFFTFYYAIHSRRELRNRKKDEDVLKDWVNKKKNHDNPK